MRKKRNLEGQSDEFMDAWAGPYCKTCGLVRTKNPSKTCAKCLGQRVCRTCSGRGEITHMVKRSRVIEACLGCSGTGIVRRPRDDEAPSRVFLKEGWWHAELDHAGKTYFIGRFNAEALAKRAAIRWRRAVLGIEKKSDRRLTEFV